MTEKITIKSLQELEDHAFRVPQSAREYLEGVIQEYNNLPWRKLEGTLYTIDDIGVSIRMFKRVPSKHRGEMLIGAALHEHMYDSFLQSTSMNEMTGRIHKGRAGHAKEMLRDERVLVQWEKEIWELTRAVVVGSAGSGKTILTQWTALYFARRALEALQQGQSWDTLSFPVHVHLPELVDDLTNQEYSDCLKNYLEAKLLSYFKNGNENEYEYVVAFFEKLVKNLEQNANHWLILDALDQVPQEKQDVCQQFLKHVDAWACRIVLTCRTEQFDRHSTVPWKEIQEYELAPFNDQNIESFFRKWPDGEALWNQIQGNDEMLEICRNPLLATLTGILWQDEKRASLMKRGDLYSHTIRRLWKRKFVNEKNEDIEERMNILQEMAWELFFKKPGSNDFLYSTLKQKIQKVNAHVDAKVFIEHLCKTGILYTKQTSGQNTYSFPHPTMLAYLAGCALARKLENGRTMLNFIDKKAWDPRWWDVITFAGWAMNDPTPLLELLHDESKDDIFRHRLALALSVLREVNFQKKNDTIFREIIDEGWEFWINLKLSMKNLLYPWNETGESLGQLVQKHNNKKTQNLIKDLQANDIEKRFTAGINLCYLNLLNDDVFEILLENIKNTRNNIFDLNLSYLQTELIYALTKARNIDDNIIKFLIQGLYCEDSDVREASAEAFFKIHLVNDKGINALIRALKNEVDDFVKEKIIKALGRVSINYDSKKKIINVLIPYLNHRLVSIQEAALSSIMRLGRDNKDIVVNAIMNSIITEHPNNAIENKIHVLKNLGISDEAILDRIRHLFDEESINMLISIIAILQYLNIVNEEIICFLTTCLKHPNREVRKLAATTCWKLNINTENIIITLNDLLNDKEVKGIAAISLALLGNINNKVIETLYNNLYTYEYCYPSAKLLIDISNDYNKLRSILIGRLKKEDCDGRFVAISTLIFLDLVNNDVLQHINRLLKGMLEDRSYMSIILAKKKLKKMNDELIESIIGLVHDENVFIRTLGIMALENQDLYMRSDAICSLLRFFKRKDTLHTLNRNREAIKIFNMIHFRGFRIFERNNSIELLAMF